MLASFDSLRRCLRCCWRCYIIARCRSPDDCRNNRHVQGQVSVAQAYAFRRACAGSCTKYDNLRQFVREIITALTGTDRRNPLHQVRTSYQRMSQTVTNHWIRSEFSSNASKHTSGDDLRQSQAYKRNTGGDMCGVKRQLVAFCADFANSADHGKRDSIKFGPGNEDASQDTPREAQQLVQEYDGFRSALTHA